MKRTYNRSARALAAALTALAWIGSANAKDESRNATAADVAQVQSPTPVPSAQRFDLQAYGDRFKLAIEAIDIDAKKPEWTWDDSDLEERTAQKK